MVSSQGGKEDMYKLTYDSDDNDEINAPTTLQKNQPSTTNPKMKPDIKDSKENTQEKSSPKEKKKSVGTYEGNGRYYSLFANENFLTEDATNQKKKCCRVGVKSVFLIVTILLLLLAMMGMMWVVRGMQVEQDSLKMRISKLEDSSSTNINPPFNHPSMQAAAVNPFHSQDSACCNTNKEQISYLEDVLKGHESRFRNVEEKVQEYRRLGDVRDAEISRNIAQNAADVTITQSSVQSVDVGLSEVRKIADAARNLALFATKDASLTEDQIDEYLRELGGSSREGAAFAVAHAMGNTYVIKDYPDEAMTDFVQSEPPTVYDVSSEFSPVVSFTENSLNEAGKNSNIQPESGTFTITESGKYFLSVSFCVQTHLETTIQILRNGVVLREFTVPGILQGPTSYSDESMLGPPPGFYDLLEENEKLLLPPGAASDTTQPIITIKPYQFNDIASLETNDELQMKILKGTIAEYTYLPDTNAAKSCTRFLGFRL